MSDTDEKTIQALTMTEHERLVARVAELEALLRHWERIEDENRDLREQLRLEREAHHAKTRALMQRDELLQAEREAREKDAAFHAHIASANEAKRRQIARLEEELRAERDDHQASLETFLGKQNALTKDLNLYFDQLQAEREKSSRLEEALRAVVAVADRKTPEFDQAHAALSRSGQNEPETPEIARAGQQERPID